MSLFNDKVNTILEATNLDANELKPGDICLNTNKDCDHFMSKGIVMRRTPFKNATGTVGNLVRYLVLNKGNKFKPGDILDKTEIQLSKLEEEEESKLSKLANMVQGALDIAGLEPTIGTAADATNAVISTLRAAIAKEPDMRKKHLMNAGISAVSMIPFGDVAKLAKLRKIRKPLTKGLKAVKGYAKKQKSPLKDRFGVTENYADGKVKGKSRPGRVKRSGASCKGSVTSLRAKAKKAGGEKGKMYHWCANMKGGKKK